MAQLRCICGGKSGDVKNNGVESTGEFSQISVLEIADEAPFTFVDALAVEL